MAGGSHRFDEAFAKLTSTISDQADGNGIIYVDENIRRPFESTCAPTSNQALQDFARIFEGDDSHSLFLRFDGCAIYLVVSTVLQFPPCSLLNKTIYFFMDMLNLYADRQDTRQILQAHLSESLPEKEVEKRQKYIFSQLVPRLKSLLFQNDKHYKVKRLIAQLITRLCRGDARGWQELMDAQERRPFGTLLNEVDDYVLRVLIADIIRHLSANNYGIHELWEQSSEEVLDFPASQKLHPATISKMLDSMSAMDAKQAVRDARQSRLYRIADINIPDLQYHSAQSDTIVITDDALTLLMPDRDSGGTIFTIYEISITQETFLEKAQSPTKRALHLRICWNNAQGRIVVRGKKESVKEVHLEFVEQSSHDDFCEAFNAILERRTQDSWVAASQESINTVLQSQRSVTEPKHFSKTRYGFEQGSQAQQVLGVDDPTDKRPKIAEDTSEQISSGPIVEVNIASDVFARTFNEGQSSNKSTDFSRRLMQETATRTFRESPPMLLSSHDDVGGDNEASSPLKIFGKGKGGEEAAIRSSKSIPVNPALSVPLHQQNDVDYASLLTTAQRVRTSNNEETSIRFSQPRKRLYRDTDSNEQDESSELTKASKDTVEMVRPATDVAKSMSETSIDGVTAAPKKKSQTASSFLKSKNSRLLTQDPRSSESSAHVRIDPKEMQMDSLGRKKKTDVKRNGKSISKHVDWDQDLRTDEHKSKRQKTKSDMPTKTVAKKPLKAITNTSQDLTAPAKVAANGKTASKDKATTSNANALSAISAAPTRRSQRIKIHEVKSNVEPSASEDGDVTEDGSDEGDHQLVKRDKLSSLSKTEARKIPEQKKRERESAFIERPAVSSPHMNTTTEASRNYSTAKSLVEIPSRDHEDEIEDSQPKEAHPRLGDGQDNNGSAMDADVQAEKETEVLEDSYPHHNSESKAPLIAADKSFGAKLSNMLSWTPARVSEKALQISNTPFGDRNQFVRNVNAAKEVKSSPTKSIIASVVAPIAGTLIKSSKDVGTVDGPPKHQQSLESNIPAIGTPIHGVRPGSATVETSPGLATGSQYETDSQADGTRISDPMTVEAPRIVHKTSDTENETIRIGIHSSPLEKATEHGEHESQGLTAEFVESGNPHQDEDDTYISTLGLTQNAGAETTKQPSDQPWREIAVDLQSDSQALSHHTPRIHRAASSRSSITLSKDGKAVNPPRLANDSRRHRTTSTKGHSGRGSLTSDSASVSQGRCVDNASRSGQSSMATSSKTGIIHFGNVGPQNQGSPSKLESIEIPKIRPQSTVVEGLSSNSAVNTGEGSQFRRLRDQTKALNANRSVSRRVDDNSKIKEVHESPDAKLSPSGQQQANLFEDYDSFGITGDTVSNDTLQDSLVPSPSTAAVKSADLSIRRSDRASQSRQKSQMLSSAPGIMFEKNASVEPVLPAQSSQSQLCGSRREQPLCISSTHNTSEVDSEEESLRGVNADDTVLETDFIPTSPRRLSKVKRCVKELTNHNTAPSISTKLQEDQKVAETRLIRTSIPEQTSVSVKGMLAPMETKTIPASVLSKDDSRLFSLNTTARRIFGGESTSNTTSVDKPREVELPQVTKSVVEAGMRPRDESTRASSHKCPNVPKVPSTTRLVQRSNQKPREDLVNLIALGQRKAAADGRGGTADQTNPDLSIVRVKQLRPSTERYSNEISTKATLLPSTPQAFVQQLYAPTSPVRAARGYLDAERTRDSLLDDSDFAQTTLVEHPYSSESMKLQSFMQSSVCRGSSLSMSPESEAARSTIVQGRQQRSNHAQSVSGFASELQRRMLDITQEITARVESEEKLAMGHVWNYHAGSLELAKELRSNSISRLDYDAKKLAKVLREQRNSVVEVQLHLSKKALSATRCKQVSNYIEHHVMNILSKLDNVQH